MKKYKIVVFDVDGTLLDTTEGVLSSVIYTIKEHRLRMLPEEQLKCFIGPPIQDSFQKFYHCSKEDAQQLAETFRNRYKDIDLLKAVPYPGIYEVFEGLKTEGIKLAVATYKRQDYATKILEHFGFHKYTSVLYGADPYNKLKKKDIIEKCMIDLGEMDYSQAVMVGDSDNDAIGALNLGMHFLGVTYGFGFKANEQDAYPNLIGWACTPKEVLSILT